MWWLILVVIICFAGFFVYSRRNGKLDLSEDQLELMRGLIKEKLEQNKIEKQKIIDMASEEGKTVPLLVLIDKLEKLKKEHQGDVAFIAELDCQMNELKDKYGDNISVGDLYKLSTDYEDKYGPL